MPAREPASISPTSSYRASTSGPFGEVGRVTISRQAMYSRLARGGGSISRNSWRQRPGTTALRRWSTDWAPMYAATWAPPNGSPL